MSVAVNDMVSEIKTVSDPGLNIQLTANAAKEVRRVREEQKLEDDVFLRIGVGGGGCSGFSYSLGFDKLFDAKLDSRFEQHGISFVVDKRSALYLDGTVVDWYESIEKRGFTFDNPNAKKTCGCGSSFQV